MLPMTLLISLIFASPSHQIGPSDDGALRNQVQRYHSNFSNGRYDLMWEMLSRNRRGENDNDKKGYIRQLRRYGFGKVRAQITKIEIAGDRATVRVKLTVWSKLDKKWFSEVNDETWVLEDGRWVFEDHQVAESAMNGGGT